MTSSLLHPGIILILFGLFIPLIKNRLIVLLFPIASFIILFLSPSHNFSKHIAFQWFQHHFDWLLLLDS